MKSFYLMVALLAATAIAQAQDTYLNDRVTASDDVIGTARYVGMGGALGALGADLSVMSSNPAGTGLYRKSDVAISFGAVVPTGGGWNSNDASSYGEKLARASFDQLGFLWSMKGSGDVMKYVNLGINYQKKANYNHGFFADNLNLGGLSQMDQLTELAQAGYDRDNNLAGMAKANEFLILDAGGNVQPNTYRGEKGFYTRHQKGSLQAFDINLSFNLKDRFYTGLTFGLDHVDYNSWSSYTEQNQDNGGVVGDYTLYNDREIDGTGLNVKFGFISRPIEENPLRIGLAVETPTWYRLKNSTLYDLTDQGWDPAVDDGPRNVQTQTRESYIEYVVRTPWRARLSVGSTVGEKLAWGIEYEYANAANTKMGYPKYDKGDPNHSSLASTKDAAMNQLTKNLMQGQHTIKAGLEYKPTSALALRAGYNYITSRYKDNPSFDQFSTDSYAMDYATSTDFMTLGATNIITCGVGYKYKKFYVDLAYKYRMQDAKFYAFDTSFTSGNQFIADNPDLANASIKPVELDLNRHQITCSLGFKF